MDHIQGASRNQIKIFSWDQMIPKQSMVRIIDVFVDHLPLERMGFEKVKVNKEGRPPYHPAVLLKLYFYGYQNGLRSCRKLEKACTNNIEVIWLLNERKPHFKTIANFRKENVKSFRKVFRHFISMLKEWELVDGAAIAIDSFKVRAQNSLKNNHNARKIKRHLDYIDAKINIYLEQLEKEDAQAEIIHAKIKLQQERRQKYLDLKEKLKASGDGQFSTTDPDSRAVVFQRNSVKVGYNIQAVSDAKNKLLVAADTGDVNDTKALAKMVEITQENLNCAGLEMNVIADKGYHSGRELKACEALKVTTYISPKESSSSKRNTKFSMDKFKYEEATDTYICPADSVMKTNGNWYYKKLKDGKKSYYVKHYKTKSCKGCSLGESCTSNKNGRVIERTEYQEFVNRNNDRVKNNPDYYRQRQQIIEHQFGTLKRHWGFEYVLSKGKENVLSEVYTLFTAYNLKRCVSILGFERLIVFIRSFFFFSELKWTFLKDNNRSVLTFC